MFTNTIIFLSTLIIAYSLYRYYKSLKIEIVDSENPTKQELCDFKFSKPKYRKKNNKYQAKFKIKLREQNQFFHRIPFVFRFKSPNRFKAMIKIEYINVHTGRENESMMRKRLIEFDGHNEKEHRYKMDDFIAFNIRVTIESEIEYGKPEMTLVIEGTDKCEINKNYKQVVKYPERLYASKFLSKIWLK